MDGAPARGIQAAPTSPPWGAIGLAAGRDPGAPGVREPGRRVPARGSGNGVRKPTGERQARGLGRAAPALGAVSGGRRRGVGLRAECADSPSAAGSHWTARGGAEAGDTRGPLGGSARARPGRSAEP